MTDTTEIRKRAASVPDILKLCDEVDALRGENGHLKAELSRLTAAHQTLREVVDAVRTELYNYEFVKRECPDAVNRTVALNGMLVSLYELVGAKPLNYPEAK